MELEDSRVTIVGLGLMGGSMALCLQPRCHELVGVDSKSKTVELARRAGLMTQELSAAIVHTDVLVLATPVKETLRLLEVFTREPPDVSLLMDIGSTKRQVVEAMELLPDSVAAVGGHPLCGKEGAGFSEAEAGLFSGSLFVLTPCSRTTPSSLALAEQLVDTLGATVRQMEAARHDRLLAAASHLPYLLAAALMGSAESFGRGDPELWDLVASGFLSTSRLAASDLTMMIDILITNHDMVQDALSRAQAELRQLRKLLDGGESGPLREYLEPLQKRRDSLKDPGGCARGA
ncbi:MAG: prephenate dehydrogenase [Anaerolineae bacterium]|nr:MAG: prephenate dehydrogenase [Anaerolineae bacterium]